MEPIPEVTEDIRFTGGKLLLTVQHEHIHICKRPFYMFFDIH